MTELSYESQNFPLMLAPISTGAYFAAKSISGLSESSIDPLAYCIHRRADIK